MKKIFVWAVGIILGLSVLGNIFPSDPSVKGVDTFVTPTVSATVIPTNTQSPTATETPVPTQKPVYIAPTATPIPDIIQTSGLNNDNYYTNVDGNQVHSPAYSNTIPDGASAICGDGTYSFSQNRRGTCSHHGGVAQWL